MLDIPLSPSEKIGLLLGALEREALHCAGRAERLDQVELDRIWAKLVKTYDIKYQQVQTYHAHQLHSLPLIKPSLTLCSQQVYAHISAILNIKPLAHASAEKLRAIIDITDEHLRMLKRFEIKTEEWSSIVCVILLGKLDAETRNQWEVKTELPDMPKVEALFTFLEQRILAIRNIEQSALHQQFSSASSEKQGQHKAAKSIGNESHRFRPYNSDQRYANVQAGGRSRQDEHRKSDVRAKPPACPMCGNGETHFLWNCDSFKRESSGKQTELLNAWNLCKICLIAKHPEAECSKENCPVCKTERHNSAICPKAKAKQSNHIRRGGKGKSKPSE